ncbi:Kinase/ Wee [Giardia duodenalis assemblage B]|uniref:non-specific serine/threonine protein kinase n=1 Tax=Giardia duodenalis assemblage B TaxID=1394984 RepID=A0A132NVY5_GIAIN|nr:Kinase/ Wee [Giardia intestinalis assemblage B]
MVHKSVISTIFEKTAAQIYELIHNKMPFTGSAHPSILQQKGPTKQKMQRPETPLGASMARRTCMEGSLVYLDKSANVKSMQRVNHSIIMANYTVLELLGQGCSGKTYKVLFQRDGRLYAMKKRRTATSEDIKEGILITSLSCPVCIPCYLCWVEDNSTYFVTDLAHCSLDSILNCYHFLVEELIWIMMADISMALEYIHASGVVHCDLKPENILVTNRIDGYNIPPKNCGDSYTLDNSMDRLTPINDPDLKKSHMTQRIATVARSVHDKPHVSYLNKSQQKPFSVTSSSTSQPTNAVPATNMASMASTPMHTSIVSNIINQRPSEEALCLNTSADQLSLRSILPRTQSDAKETSPVHRQSHPCIISPCYERADDGKYFVRDSKGGFLLDKINLIKRSYSDSTLVVLKHTETMLSNNYPREYIFCEYEDHFYNEVQDNSHLIIQHFEQESPMRTRPSTAIQGINNIMNQTIDISTDWNVRIPHLGMSEPIINFHLINISERISDTDRTRSFEKPQSTMETSVDSVIFSSKQDLELPHIEDESSGDMKIHSMTNELKHYSSVLAVSTKSLAKADDVIECVEEPVQAEKLSTQVVEDHPGGTVHQEAVETLHNNKSVTLLATYKRKPAHQHSTFDDSEDAFAAATENLSRFISLKEDKSLLCAALRKLPKGTHYRIALLALINKRSLYSLYFSTRFLYKKTSNWLAYCPSHTKKMTYHMAKLPLLNRGTSSVPVKPKRLAEDMLLLPNHEHSTDITALSISDSQDQESTSQDQGQDPRDFSNAITIGLSKNVLLESGSSLGLCIDEVSVKNANYESSKSSILSSHPEVDTSTNAEGDVSTKQPASISHQSIRTIAPISTTTRQYNLDMRHLSGNNKCMDIAKKQVHNACKPTRHAIQGTPPSSSRSGSESLSVWNSSRPTNDLSLSLLMDPTSVCDSVIADHVKHRMANSNSFKSNPRLNEVTNSLSRAALQGQGAFLEFLPDDMQLFNLSHSAQFQNGSFSADVQAPFFDDYSYPNSRFVFSPAQSSKTQFHRSAGAKKKPDPCIYASSSKVHRLCRPKEMYTMTDSHPFQQMGFIDSEISCLLPPYSYQLYRTNNLLSTSMCGDTYGNHSQMNFLSLAPSNSHTPINPELITTEVGHDLPSSDEGSVQHTPLLTPRQPPEQQPNSSQPFTKSASSQESAKQSDQYGKPILSPMSLDTSLTKSSAVNTCTQSLLQNLVFTLSDFGHAQEAPFKESNTGDSRYICPQFLRTGLPDYSADVYSFGMTILEVMTNVNIPPNGEPFERLRSHKKAVLDMLDSNLFGRNLSAQLSEDDTGSNLHKYLSFIGPRISYSKDLWLAMLDLIEPDVALRPSIKSWRKKWKHQLDRLDRTKLYQKIESDQRAVNAMMNDCSLPSVMDKTKEASSKDAPLSQCTSYTSLPNDDGRYNPFQSAISCCKQTADLINTSDSTQQSRMYCSRSKQMLSQSTNNSTMSNTRMAPTKPQEAYLCQDSLKPTATSSINRTADILNTRPLNYGDLYYSVHSDAQLNPSDLYHDMHKSIVTAPSVCASGHAYDVSWNAYTKSRSRNHQFDSLPGTELLGPDLGDDCLDFDLSYRQESITPTNIGANKQHTDTLGSLRPDSYHIMGTVSMNSTKSVHGSTRPEGAETPASLDNCGYLSLNWQSSFNEDSLELEHSQSKSPTNSLQKAHQSMLTCAGLDVGALDSFSIRAESDMVPLEGRHGGPSEIQLEDPLLVSFHSNEPSDSTSLSTELQLKALTGDVICEDLDAEPKDGESLVKSAVNTALGSRVPASVRPILSLASPRHGTLRRDNICTPDRSQIDSVQDDASTASKHMSAGQPHSSTSFTSNRTDRGRTHNPVQSTVHALLNSPMSGTSEQSDQSDVSVHSSKSSKSCNSMLHQSAAYTRGIFKSSLLDQKHHLACQKRKESISTPSLTSNRESVLSSMHSMSHISPLYSSLGSVVLSAKPFDTTESSLGNQSASFCIDGMLFLSVKRRHGRAISQMTRRELQIIEMNSAIDDSTTSLHERPEYCPVCKLLHVPSDLRLTQRVMALCPSSSQAEDYIHYCVCAQANTFSDAGEFTHSYSEPACSSYNNHSLDKLFLSCYIQKENCNNDTNTRSSLLCTTPNKTTFSPGTLVSQKAADSTASTDKHGYFPNQFALSHVSASHPPSTAGPWMLPFSKTKSLMLTYTERLIVSAISYLSLRSGIYTSMQVPSEAASCFTKYEQTPTAIGCKADQVLLFNGDRVHESSRRFCLEAECKEREARNTDDNYASSLGKSGLEEISLNCKQRRRLVSSTGTFKAVGWADDLDGTGERVQKSRSSTLVHSKSGMLARLPYEELQRLGYVTPIPGRRHAPTRQKRSSGTFVLPKEATTWSSGEPCVLICSLAFTAHGVFNCLLILNIGLISLLRMASVFRWIGIIFTIVLSGVLASVLKGLNMHLVFENKSPEYICIPHTRVYISPRQIVAVCLRFLFPVICFVATGVGLSLYPQSRFSTLLLALAECMLVTKVGRISM